MEFILWQMMQVHMYIGGGNRQTNGLDPRHRASEQ